MPLQVLLTGRFDGFMVLAMLWAAVNAIPPLLFIVYFFTKGWLLRWSCFLGQILGLLLGAGGSIMPCHMSCCIDRLCFCNCCIIVYGV